MMSINFYLFARVKPRTEVVLQIVVNLFISSEEGRGGAELVDF